MQHVVLMFNFDYFGPPLTQLNMVMMMMIDTLLYYLYAHVVFLAQVIDWFDFFVPSTAFFCGSDQDFCASAPLFILVVEAGGRSDKEGAELLNQI